MDSSHGGAAEKRKLIKKWGSTKTNFAQLQRNREKVAKNAGQLECIHFLPFRALVGCVSTTVGLPILLSSSVAFWRGLKDLQKLPCLSISWLQMNLITFELYYAD